MKVARTVTSGLALVLICLSIAHAQGSYITSVSPDSGSTFGGDTVTINGFFSPPVGYVKFGGVYASVVGSPTSSSISVTTPSGTPGYAAVEIADNNGPTFCSSCFQYVSVSTGPSLTNAGYDSSANQLKLWFTSPIDSVKNQVPNGIRLSVDYGGSQTDTLPTSYTYTISGDLVTINIPQNHDSVISSWTNLANLRVEIAANVFRNTAYAWNGPIGWYSTSISGGGSSLTITSASYEASTNILTLDFNQSVSNCYSGVTDAIKLSDDYFGIHNVTLASTFAYNFVNNSVEITLGSSEAATLESWQNSNLMVKVQAGVFSTGSSNNTLQDVQVQYNGVAGTSPTLVNAVYDSTSNQLRLRFSSTIDTVDNRVTGGVRLSADYGGGQTITLPFYFVYSIAGDQVTIDISPSQDSTICSWSNLSNLQVQIAANVFRASNNVWNSAISWYATSVSGSGGSGFGLVNAYYDSTSDKLILRYNYPLNYAQNDKAGAIRLSALTDTIDIPEYWGYTFEGDTAFIELSSGTASTIEAWQDLGDLRVDIKDSTFRSTAYAWSGVVSGTMVYVLGSSLQSGPDSVRIDFPRGQVSVSPDSIKGSYAGNIELLRVMIQRTDGSQWSTSGIWMSPGYGTPILAVMGQQGSWAAVGEFPAWQSGTEYTLILSTCDIDQIDCMPADTAKFTFTGSVSNGPTLTSAIYMASENRLLLNFSNPIDSVRSWVFAAVRLSVDQGGGYSINIPNYFNYTLNGEAVGIDVESSVADTIESWQNLSNLKVKIQQSVVRNSAFAWNDSIPWYTTWFDTGSGQSGGAGGPGGYDTAGIGFPRGPVSYYPGEIVGWYAGRIGAAHVKIKRADGLEWSVSDSLWKSAGYGSRMFVQKDSGGVWRLKDGLPQFESQVIYSLTLDAYDSTQATMRFMDSTSFSYNGGGQQGGAVAILDYPKGPVSVAPSSIMGHYSGRLGWIGVSIQNELTQQNWNDSKGTWGASGSVLIAAKGDSGIWRVNSGLPSWELSTPYKIGVSYWDSATGSSVQSGEYSFNIESNGEPIDSGHVFALNMSLASWESGVNICLGADTSMYQSYSLYRMAASGPVFLKDLPNQELCHFEGGLSAGMEYTFFATGRRKDGGTDSSGRQTIMVSGESNPGPSNPLYLSNAPQGVRICLGMPSNDIPDEVRIMRGLQNPVLVASLPDFAADGCVLDSGVTEGQTYSYYMVITDGGSTDSTEAQEITFHAKPDIKFSMGTWDTGANICVESDMSGYSSFSLFRVDSGSFQFVADRSDFQGSCYFDGHLVAQKKYWYAVVGIGNDTTKKDTSDILEVVISSDPYRYNGPDLYVNPSTAEICVSGSFDWYRSFDYYRIENGDFMYLGSHDVAEGLCLKDTGAVPGNSYAFAAVGRRFDGGSDTLVRTNVLIGGGTGGGFVHIDYPTGGVGEPPMEIVGGYEGNIQGVQIALWDNKNSKWWTGSMWGSASSGPTWLSGSYENGKWVVNERLPSWADGGDYEISAQVLVDSRWEPTDPAKVNFQYCTNCGGPGPGPGPGPSYGIYAMSYEGNVNLCVGGDKSRYHSYVLYEVSSGNPALIDTFGFFQECQWFEDLPIGSTLEYFAILKTWDDKYDTTNVVSVTVSDSASPYKYGEGPGAAPITVGVGKQYSTIQAAIDANSKGYIEVWPGEYAPITISGAKNFEIRGRFEGGQPVIKGNGGTAITIRDITPADSSAWSKVGVGGFVIRGATIGVSISNAEAGLGDLLIVGAETGVKAASPALSTVTLAQTEGTKYGPATRFGVHNVTFIGSSVSRVAVSADSGSAGEVINSIIAGFPTGIEGGQMLLGAYNDFWQVGTKYSANVRQWGNDLAVDPQFASDGSYRLRAGSPLTTAGSDGCMGARFLGDVRALAQPPSNFVVRDKAGDEKGLVELSWTPGDTAGLIGYYLLRSERKWTPDEIMNGTALEGAYFKWHFPGRVSSLVDTLPKENTDYYFLIGAQYVFRPGDTTHTDPAGGWDGYVVARALDDVRPLSPTNFQAFDSPGDYGGSITLKWTPSASSDVVKQQIVCFENLSDTLTKGSGKIVMDTVPTVSQFVFTKFRDGTAIQNNKTYYLVVVALDDAGNDNRVNAATDIKSVSASSNAPETIVEGRQNFGAIEVVLKGVWNGRPDTGDLTYYYSLLKGGVIKNTGSSKGGTKSFFPLSDGSYEFRAYAKAPDSTSDASPASKSFTIAGATTFSLPAGIGWRMISVPSANKPASILKGGRQMFGWKEDMAARDVSNDRYEYNSSTIERGRGYWFRNPDSAISVTLSETDLLADQVAKDIVLLKRQNGWNQIGNPFSYAVDMSATGLMFYSWDPSKNGYSDPGKVLEPWKAYWVKVGADTILKVAAKPYFPAAVATVAKAKADHRNWTLRLEAKCGEKTDLNNTFGVAALAKATEDAVCFEPPSFNDNLSVYFVGESQTEQITRDIRSSQAVTQIWTFGVKGASAKPVNFEVADLAALPEQYDVYVGFRGGFRKIDKSSGQFELSQTEKNYYELVVTKDAQFPIHAGITFNLRQNFPNPVQSITRIGYTIPATWQANGLRESNLQRVKLEIYNLSGQKVRTLVNANQGAGYYEVSWQGTDTHSRTVSSGVYLYLLRAGDKAAQKRMVLVK